MQRGGLASQILDKLSSSKLALVLIIVLVLFSIAGAVLPQEGQYEFVDILTWQRAHPMVTAVMQPLGFFRVFSSWPFLAAVFVLGVNTLTCTLLRFFRTGGLAAFKGPGGVRRLGSFWLHICLILLLAGGLVTSAMRLKGRIVLTEGQTFTDVHDNYRQLLEGLLRPERHTGAVIRMQDVRVTYADRRHPLEVVSSIQIELPGEQPVAETVRVNRPVRFQNLFLTQDKTGYSPLVKMRYQKSGMRILDSYVALKTETIDKGKVYRDYLTLPSIRERLILTVIPSSLEEVDHSGLRKAGEASDQPILAIQMTDALDRVKYQGQVPLGDKLTLGPYAFYFADLRRWSALMVVEDPGYLPVALSLWLGLGALILRYIPDLKIWFGNGNQRRGRRAVQESIFGGTDHGTD